MLAYKTGGEGGRLVLSRAAYVRKQHTHTVTAAQMEETEFSGICEDKE